MLFRESKYNITEWVNTKNSVTLKRINANAYVVVGLAWFRNDYEKRSECVESNLFISTKKGCENFIESLMLSEA